MPQIVTADELRAVLGVSDSLYSDAYLDSMIESAEGAILPLLTGYQSAITGIEVKDSIAYYTTQRINYFVPGQAVQISGCGVAFDLTVTVNDHRVTPYLFTTATAAADQIFTPVIPAGLACLNGATAGDLYSAVQPVKSAILVVSVEVFQSITAPGNTSAQVDFQPSPFILGRSLQNRVVGLLAPFIDVETMCQ
jgi:hypothetical protein